MKFFKIKYKENKDRAGIERSTKITLSAPTGDLGKDSKQALNIFIGTVGNLRQYDVLEIQELDEEGNSVGEPIKPMGDSSIVPYRK